MTERACLGMRHDVSECGQMQRFPRASAMRSATKRWELPAGSRRNLTPTATADIQRNARCACRAMDRARADRCPKNHHHRRPRCQCQLEILVVVRVPAIVDRLGRLEPDRCCCQCADDVVAIGLRDDVGKLRTTRHLADLIQDRSRPGKSGSFPGTVERPARYSGRTLRRADNRAGIENDQPRGAARSAFHAATS